MKKIAKLLAVTGLLSSTLITPTQAKTVVVSGTILEDANGTYFDTWNINMLNAGNFKVNLLAYESTDNTYTGPTTSDINGDGELTFLDPDTYIYKNTGNPLVATDFLARCDDINNNCDTIDTPTIKLSSLTEAEGAIDGSIHARRDPAFNITLDAGNFLYLIADYRLSPEEAEGGINAGDSIRGDLIHADYQITFSSDTMNFAVDGTNINVSAVPVPAAIWLFGSALLGLSARKKLSA